MSGHNMPIIEPTIDYTKVPPINQKRTIAFINHFLSHIVTYLNKFSLTCEEKLFEFENKLQRVEASLAILESKLASVPDLNGHLQPKTENVNIEIPNTEEIIEKTPENEIPEELTEKIETQSISSDPAYAKYFKMVHVGVPKPAVKLKMEQEGLDSSLLDNPNYQVEKKKLPDNAEENNEDA